MPKARALSLLALLPLLAVASPSWSGPSLTTLAEWATNPPVDASDFAREVNAQRLRLLQHEPSNADLEAIPKLVSAFALADPAIQDDVLVLFTHLVQHSGKHRSAILQVAKAALSSPAVPVRKQALEVFRQSNDPAFIQVSIAMLEDPSWDVRYQALYSIAPFAEAGGHPKVFDAISVLADDDNERIRVIARSLMRFSPE
ncbi:HEAT repeat domain-containing protein [Aureimonas fodinaquatilis]|nr:HEAT repeat domain-containing protein [Aureimonas fodinaquatilis]